MSVSTNAILGYGILFEEGKEPWEEERCSSSSWLADKLEKLAVSSELCPIKIEYHCSGDYPMYALLIKESVTIASRGFPEEIGFPAESTLEQWENCLQEWLNWLGLPRTTGKFLLMSYWG